MSKMSNLPPAKDKTLYTPGPLTTSQTVKQAMLHDLGSRDGVFIELVGDIRRRLLAVGGVDGGEYEAILLPGSGTYGLEAAVSSVVPPDGKLLVIVNGAYGRRMAAIASVHHIQVETVDCPEHQLPDLEQISQVLANDRSITNVAMVHCETTTGIINPVSAVGDLVRKSGSVFLVDAMSSFGAVPLNLPAAGIDFLISSSNKCLEGVPGCAFVLASRKPLLAIEGFARTLSLDLLAQWQGFERDGQFRFTPPTHVLLALHQALVELEAEGGVQARAQRYRQNYETLIRGMRALGFHEYLDPACQGHIITSFRYPSQPQFDFETFYRRLNNLGFVIYPGKVSDADCFRIGNIGRIFETDILNLLAAIEAVQNEMGF